jgi:hypothetical protein
MAMSRRKSLGLIGGGIVLAVAAPTVGFLTTRTPTKALEPWDRAGQYSDPRMQALSYALLAPNPHNRQPWQVKLIGTDALEVYRDEARDLPVTDPFGRQLTIGMGCFLELMDIAAAAQGIRVDTTLFPNGEDGPVAACRFVAGGSEADPLFDQVLLRRSHKEKFDDRVVTGPAVDALRQYADIYLGGDDRAALRRIAHDAWLTEAATPAAWKESIDLLRIGKAEINAMPDGIDVGGPMLESLALLGMVTREAALDPNNPNARAPIEDTANAIMAAPAMMVIRSAANERDDQIAVGRQWLRLNLAATAAGLAMRPVSQALQEYPEMQSHYDEIHARFATNGETVQMLGLLGYGARTPRTPRWPIETRMMDA